MATPYSVFNNRSASDPGATVTPGVAVSGTNTYYSDMWTGESSDGYGLTVFANSTSALTGTFTLWMTDKINPGLADDTDWVQDAGFVPTNPAGATVKFRDDGGNAKAYRKRLKYVNTSGTGTLIAYVTVPHFVV